MEHMDVENPSLSETTDPEPKWQVFAPGSLKQHFQLLAEARPTWIKGDFSSPYIQDALSAVGDISIDINTWQHGQGNRLDQACHGASSSALPGSRRYLYVLARDVLRRDDKLPADGSQAS